MGFFSRFRKKDDVEERSAAQQIARDWFMHGGLQMINLYGTAEEDTGVNVTPENALQAASVWACVSRIARDLSSCPVHVIDREGGGRVTDHPIAGLLERPNEYHTGPAFWQMYIVNLLLYGWSGALVGRRRDGYASSILPLMSRDVEPHRVNGRVFYRVSPGGVLRADQVMATAYMSRDGVCGTSPIAAGARAIGTDIALASFAGRFFKQGANSGTFLEMPSFQNADAWKEAARQIKEQYTGMNSAHGVFAYPQTKPHKLGNSPRDSQAVEARQHQLGEVARIYNMPIGLLDAERSKYAGLSAQYEDYHRATLRPWAILVLAEATRKLFPVSERGRYKLAWNFDALLEADLATRADVVVKLVQGGIITENEGREKLRYPPLPGGDELLSPLNMAPASTRSSDPVPDPRVSVLVESIVGSVVTKETNALKAALRKGPDHTRSWADKFFETHAEHIHGRLPIASIQRARASAAEARSQVLQALDDDTADELLQTWPQVRAESIKNIAV